MRAPTIRFASPLLGCLAVTLSGVVAAAPQPGRNEADLVARGHYLAEAAHCAACHTRPGGADYAGNLPLGSSFGTLYASNITPDPDTGIGKWTEKQFEGALRRGVDDHGAPLYPAMPYLQFTKISDDDVHALWAYFRTVKPVREATRANDMKFPFNVRSGVAGWQLLYFKAGRYVPDPSQSEQWNRGAYLVEGLGHCGACHSPTNVLQAPKKGESLQGNVIDHWFAPDISGGRYSGIKDWSEQQVVTYLKTGHNDKNEAAVGPMQQTIDLGTSRLSDTDLNDIAIYLKRQVTGTPDSEPKTKRPVTQAERASGKAIYADNCATCHGANGNGAPGIAPALAGASSVAGKQPDTAVRAVLQGFAPHAPWGVMPAFGEVLRAEEVSDVVNYIRTSWGNNGAGRVDASMVNHMARYADFGDGTVDSAVVCPSAKAASLDPATLAQVKALADTSAPQSATDRLVKDYRARHPKVGTTEIITTISGAYCRGVMAASKGTLAERQQRYIAFTGHVAQSAAGK